MICDELLQTALQIFFCIFCEGFFCYLLFINLMYKLQEVKKTIAYIHFYHKEITGSYDCL